MKIIIALLCLFSCRSKEQKIVSEKNIFFINANLDTAKNIAKTHDYSDTSDLIVTYETMKKNISFPKAIAAKIITGNIQKKNGVISVLIKNKDAIIFKDNSGVPYDEDRRANIFLGYLPQIKKYLLKSEFYEYSLFYLIDKINGRQDSLDALPVFSPSGKFFVTVIKTQRIPLLISCLYLR